MKPALPRTALFLILALLLLPACGGGGGGGGSTTNPIDRLVMSVPDPEQPKSVDDNVAQPPVRQNGWEIIRHKRTVMLLGQKYPVLAARAEIYPGADIQGRSVVFGFLNPITAPRGSGTIVISNITGNRSTIELAEIGLGPVSTAINSIIDSQPQQFPANIRFSFKRIRSHEELAIELGASASFAGIFDAASNFRLRTRRDNTAILVTLEQGFYSIGFERPSRPHEFYAPGTGVEELQPQVGPGNPATYIDQVNYGRVFYLLVQTTDEFEAMFATLQANIGLGVFGGQMNLKFNYLTDFHNLEVQAYAYGGDARATMEAILRGMADWKLLREGLESGADLRLALPLSYSVRSLATDEILKNGISADYEYEVTNALGRPIPNLLSPASLASLDNGCGIVADPVDWDFAWEETPNTNRYEIEIRRNNDLIALQQTESTEFHYRGSGARPRSGYRWRVRAHADWNEWQEWTEWREFTLEAPNTDCAHTGVVLFTHPGYSGGSITFEALGSRRVIDLEKINGWDDEIDSMRLTNCRIRLYEDPLRAPWHGGANRLFMGSTPDVLHQGFRRNAATVIEFDLGFPWEWLDL